MDRENKLFKSAKAKMDKEMTLGKFLVWVGGIVSSMLILGIQWNKSHEEAQDKAIMDLKSITQIHEVRVDRFDEDLSNISTTLLEISKGVIRIELELKDKEDRE